MPAISTPRTQTSSGYLQSTYPSGLNSEFRKLELYSAEGCSPSLTRTQTSNYNSATTTANISSYSTKLYPPNGRNYDSSYKSNRIGVSSNNNRFNYSISSSDRANSIQKLKDRTPVFNDNLDNTVYNTLTKKYSNMLQSKPPTYYGNRNIRSSISQSRSTQQHKHNNTKFNLATNSNQLNTQLSKSSSFDHVFNNYSKKTDHNSKDINNFEHNQLSSSSSSSYSDQRQKNDFNNSYTSSSLARLVATSGVDIYEKYSPAHYISKCDLSRSRSLSEATTATSSSVPTEFNKINNNNFNNINISNGNISDQKNHYNNDNSSSSNGQQIDNCPPLDDSINLRDLKISSNNSSITSSSKDATENKSQEKPAKPTKKLKVKSSINKETNIVGKECDIDRATILNLQLKNSDNNNNKSFVAANGKVCVGGLQGESILTVTADTITPLVHKSNLTNKILKKPITIPKTANMNCMQNSTEIMDTIEYIDSEDMPHENLRMRHNTSQRPRPKSSILSSSNQHLFDNIDNYNINKYKSNGANNTTSTLPLLVKNKTDYLCKDTCISSSSVKARVKRYNNLSEIKKHQIRSSTGNLATNNKNYNSSNLATTDNSQISNGHHLINPKAYNYQSSQVLTSKQMINNCYGKNNDTESPTISPQTQRNLHSNVNCGQTKINCSQLTNNTEDSQSTVTNTHSHQKMSKSLISSTMVCNKKVASNKINDNSESFRDYTIRSARPPPSPTLRSWERDTSKSSISSNRNLSNDNEPTYGRPYSTYSTQTSSSSEEKVDGLRGLRNIGNTCFMNSVIQCLSHTSELTNFLKTQTNVSTSTKDQQILNEFAKLIREMWSSNVHSVAPRDLKNAFSSKHRMYSGYNQQDAQEFLRFFLDSLHCALNTGTKGQPLNIDDSLSDNKKADLTWEWYSKIENSMIKDLFVGQFKSTLTCTNCGNTSVTFDPFWDLSVPLPSSSRCKLDACFEYFIKEEVLDGDEMPTCSKCKTRRKSTKTFRIQRFPKYLVIHLKRFSETRWSKLTNIVEFPTRERGLNMSPCAANSSNAYYTLYAISNHMGSTAGGHYVALCKNPVSKQWHEFNDNEVCSIPESSLVSSSAYLLFYERAS